MTDNTSPKPAPKTAESDLASAVALLKRLKRDLMHKRRFGDDTLHSYRNGCAQAEGDIEEWLIENGYLKSQD